MSDQESDFAHDLLRGADEIAEFLFGSRSLRRKVYHIAQTSNVPTFKLGSMICARKSVLLAWVASQEQRHANDNHDPAEKAAKVGNL
ncbi:DNA-binding protein [Methylocystis sp. MJC1]|uniref:DNA-binding protein n=1 Tax=Methylocystis sp. MJC1 TaxID=2654282 RepID=UPI0019CFA4C7|nr:DNA-binding protein [Methylocystis sp. MJC1]KAF2989438.1 hypothetical protein MJC1_03412 [Methylocystis sp. MJC1]MBU6527970.1 DNA-binding protein [Methylocystis sp. MJC1]UZX10891.1 DNA-binding protein [Methylocystis sp. MJC1]